LMNLQMGSLVGTACWRNSRTSAECRFKATWLPPAIAATSRPIASRSAPSRTR
jgi:hypothetical protein